MRRLINLSPLYLGLCLSLSACAQAEGQKTEQASQSPAAQSSVAGLIDTNAQYTLSELDQTLLLSFLRRTPDSLLKDQIEALNTSWSPAYIPPSIELYNFISEPKIRRAVLNKLRDSTGQDFGTDMNDWFKWLWNEPEIKITGYDNFKSDFYRQIDPKFGKYFKDRAATARIRLDEIRWGGVVQDGIPPLRQPKMISAKKADYLEDDNVVFGIEVNGDVRAYPKRILAWHEMFVDEVGGTNFAGVYCTLCGTVILYETDTPELNHDMGTSGFLYRSNKLMYDQATQSMWNTIKGEPVLGPLAGKNIALEHQSVVTTTWGKWKELHPDTKVLSLDTGHRRNYGEGVAYHEYFATDDLMFNTPFSDHRLKNKQEVLALRFKKYPRDQLAISAKFLKDHPVYSGKVGEQKFVVLTDETGANRVYDPAGITFTQFDGTAQATDLDGQVWKVTESKLVSADGRVLKRLPYHRAFWFGWHATYPNSKLIN